MNLEHLAPLVLIQVVTVVALTALLFRLGRQLRHEQHIYYWAWAWLATVLHTSISYYYVGFGAEAMARTPQDQSAIQVVAFAAYVALGWLQPPLTVLAAWSLRSGSVGRKAAWGMCLAGPAMGLSLAALGRALQLSTTQIVALALGTRTVLAALTTMIYAWALQRYYRRCRTAAGRMVVLCCGAYGVHLLLFALTMFGLPWFGRLDSAQFAIFGAIIPLALSVALIISVMEGAEAAETKLGQVWDSSVDGMRLISTDGRILRVNDAYCRMVGQRREELEGRPFDVSYEFEDPAVAWAKFRAFAAGDATEQRVRHSLRLRDGLRVHFELSHSLLDTPDGRQIFTVVRDITAEQEAVAALKLSEERLHTVLDSVNDGVFDWKPLDGTVYVSPSMYRLLGQDPQQTVASHEKWFRLVHPDDLERMRASFRSILSGQAERSEVQYRIQAAGRGFIWVLSRSAVYERDAEGRPVRVVGVLTEIEALKQAEQERERLQQELLHAQRLESLGMLAGGVAHDFNNLLTIINGFNHLAAAEVPEDGPAHRHIHQALLAGERAADVTRQLLILGRNPNNEPNIVPVREVILGCERMISWAANAGTQVELDPHPDSGHVRLGAGQLEQILLNLVTHARDAMPQGGRLRIDTGVVEGVELKPLAAPGRLVRIRLSSIAEPFSSTPPRREVTGPALASVEATVRQWGGMLRVESEPEAGLAVSVYLPWVQSEDAQRRAEPALDSSAGENILLVEDNEQVREFVAETLRIYGYQVRTAGSGDEALQLTAAEINSIALLIADVQMPGVNGIELARRLREWNPALRVLLMSGAVGQPIPLSSGEPRTGFLQKPFTGPALAAEARRILRTSRPASILVADDEAPVRLFFRTVLEGRGYQVAEAANGKAALEMIARTEYDLLITDLIMPEKEGIETILELRNRKSPRIIAVSGAFNAHFLAISRKLGARATLSKPVAPETLLSTVRSVLAG